MQIFTFWSRLKIDPAAAGMGGQRPQRFRHPGSPKGPPATDRRDPVRVPASMTVFGTVAGLCVQAAFGPRSDNVRNVEAIEKGWVTAISTRVPPFFSKNFRNSVSPLFSTEANLFLPERVPRIPDPIRIDIRLSKIKIALAGVRHCIIEWTGFDIYFRFRQLFRLDRALTTIGSKQVGPC